MRIKGKITHWNREKAYGFITPESGAKQVFVHLRGFTNPSATPQVGDLVSFILSTDREGRPCAAHVTFGNAVPEGAIRRNDGLLWSGVAAVFLLFVLLAAVGGLLPAAVPVLYLVASAAAYFVYSWDKSAARASARRIPEDTLHALALLGGWPGALIAQQTLRHKSRKASFQTLFWITVIANCVFLFWLFTPAGAEMLEGLLSAR